MKKLIIFAMLLAICSLSSYAQTSSSRLTEEQKNEWKARLDAYREKLNLTDEQKPKVEEANMDYLNPTNVEVLKVYPSAAKGESLSDVRLAVVRYLEKNSSAFMQ